MAKQFATEDTDFAEKNHLSLWIGSRF